LACFINWKQLLAINPTLQVWGPLSFSRTAA
jgi:hypothetical protein